MASFHSKLFMEKYYDLKPLTKEEIAWLEEHFIDFVSSKI